MRNTRVKQLKESYSIKSGITIKKHYPMIRYLIGLVGVALLSVDMFYHQSKWLEVAGAILLISFYTWTFFFQKEKGKSKTGQAVDTLPEALHKELFDFAYGFANNCKTIPDGLYVSDDKKYIIEYLPEILSSDPPHKPLSTTSRVCKSDGVVQISRSKIEGKSESFVLFQVLWCLSTYYINNDMDNLTEGDLSALNLMFENNYQFKRSVLFGELCDSFSESALYKGTIDRVATISDYIKSYDQNKLLEVGVNDSNENP